MISTILRGVFSIGDIVSGVFGYLRDRKRIEGEVIQEGIRADLETRRLAQQVVLAEQGWWVTKWIRPLFAYPLILYYTAHILDSLFVLPYHIQPLPAHIGEWSGWIVAAYFFTRPFEKAYRGWITRK